MTYTNPAALEEAIQSAFDSMRRVGPKPMLRRIEVSLEDHDAPTASERTVVDFMVNADANSSMHRSTAIVLAEWDAAGDTAWSSSEVGTPGRREQIYDLLAIDGESRRQLDAAFPSRALVDTVLVSKDWTPWYTQERQSNDFYWRAYRRVLEDKNWQPEAIAEVGASASKIVSRLSDPTSESAYSAKGLVVGYVQSGKTANFTGMIAKSIDAGYRLIIVLTGTVELLRAQTQRRLDMELIGEQNILGGRQKEDVESLRDVDYAGEGDTEWLEGKFLRHEIDPSSRRDVPSIKRLTTASGDYRALKQGLDTLDFRSSAELADPSKPVHHPDNLFGTDVRVAIVKKNKSAMTKLLTDLKNIRTRLDEIPVLLIDDEADQASVNTKNPNRAGRATDEDKERTAINKLISEILAQMPRAQYVGYTATPFANVFVEPDDQIDIFPRDFIVRLKASDAYMGGTSFHDLSQLEPGEDRSPENSNELAHVRPLNAEKGSPAERAEIRSALDAFVLTGAIKLWRNSNEPDLRFKHHTMLVHEDRTQASHAELATLVKQVWVEASYHSPEALLRLRELFETDFKLVHEARSGWGNALPGSFDELKVFIGTAISKIMSDGTPVVIVNGSRESDYNAMDFTTKDFWRVMLGGTKLSRGFTVEGLTITYFKRRAMAADTFMQMGRWFGYRPGYRDLVRLYIARDVEGPRGRRYDLYEAFTAMVQDEEAFRDQLDEYSKLDPESGQPVVQPIDVPPLVYQQLPWLRPTAGNKMYNVELAVDGSPGTVRDYVMHPSRDDGSTNIHHFNLVAPWLRARGELLQFRSSHSQNLYNARVAIISAEEVVEKLSQYRWHPGYSFEPTLEFMRRAIERGTLEDFAVIFPELKVNGEILHPVLEHDVQVLQRSRRERPGFSGSSPHQRLAAEFIAGSDRDSAGDAAEQIRRDRGRGSILFTFADDILVDGQPRSRPTDELHGALLPENIVSIFSIVMPESTRSLRRVAFRAKRNDVTYADIIEAD